MDTFQNSATFWRFAAHFRAARGFKTAHFRAAIVTLFLLLIFSGCGHKAAPFRAAAEGLAGAPAGESLQGFAPAAEIRS